MLLYAQDEVGYVSDAVDRRDRRAHRHLLELDVRNVTQLLLHAAHQAAGKYNVQVCTNISCMLRGGYEILDHCKAEAGHRP